jgi:transcriptional regulator with XRE-family HTH domain
MKTVTDLSKKLRNALVHQKLTQAELKDRAGVSQRTLTNVLSGNEDFKVSTLMALADRLGLELLLVPKGAARMVEASEVTEPAVKSRVSAALERVRGTVKAEYGR